MTDRTNLVKLRKLRDTLLDLRDDCLGDALFILIDCMVDAGDGNISDSFDNIGIDVTNNVIDIVDIKNGTSIATLELTIN